MNALTLIISGVTTLLSWYKVRAKATQDLRIAEINARKEMIISNNTAKTQWELAQLVDKDKPLRYGSFVLFWSPLLSGLFGPGVHNYVMGLWHGLDAPHEYVLMMMCFSVFGHRDVPRFIWGTMQAVFKAIRKPQLPVPKETEENF